METTFRSILREEMESFLDLVKLSVNPVAYQRTLADFDGFLFDEHLAEKKLCREQIGKWLGREQYTLE